MKKKGQGLLFFWKFQTEIHTNWTYRNCCQQVHNTTHVSEHRRRNCTCSSHWIYQSAKDRNYQNFKHFCVDVYSVNHSLNRAFQGQNKKIGLKYWNTEVAYVSNTLYVICTIDQIPPVALFGYQSYHIFLSKF